MKWHIIYQQSKISISFPINLYQWQKKKKLANQKRN